MNIPAVRDALKTALATVGGLRCHDTIPDDIAPPAAVVVPDDPFVSYDEAMQKGLAFLFFRVTLLASRTAMNAGQDQLDGFLSSGAAASSSVVDALEADRTLGGTASSLNVLEAVDYGTADIGSVSYLKADVRVRVLVRRQ